VKRKIGGEKCNTDSVLHSAPRYPQGRRAGWGWKTTELGGLVYTLRECTVSAYSHSPGKGVRKAK